MRYFLGLGSNLGDKQKNLARALNLLKRHGVRILRASAVYLTQPVGDPGQPWFYNQTVEVRTRLLPEGVLKMIKKIEAELGRTKTGSTGPRPIDIDILLAEDLIIRRRPLIVPHPRLEKRNFVLIPLEEIAPEVVHPALGMSVSALRRECPDRSIVRRLKPRLDQTARPEKRPGKRCGDKNAERRRARSQWGSP